MANDQGKTGQQGGTTQTNPGNVPNDREKSSQAGQQGGQSSGANQTNDPQRNWDEGRQGGQMPDDQSDMRKPGGTQQGGQGATGNPQDDAQRAGGGAQQGGKGGHGAGSRSDNGQRDKDDASQAVQDEDSGMTDDNR